MPHQKDLLEVCNVDVLKPIFFAKKNNSRKNQRYLIVRVYLPRLTMIMHIIRINFRGSSLRLAPNWENLKLIAGSALAKNSRQTELIFSKNFRSERHVLSWQVRKSTLPPSSTCRLICFWIDKGLKRIWQGRKKRNKILFLFFVNLLYHVVW